MLCAEGGRHGHLKAVCFEQCGDERSVDQHIVMTFVVTTPRAVLVPKEGAWNPNPR